MVLEFPMMADYTTICLESGKLLFATHGHIFNPQHLPPMPEGSAFIFGHIHVKHAERQGSTLILNPGSLSIPKDGTNSYMIYENGVFTAKTIDGETVMSAEY